MSHLAEKLIKIGSLVPEIQAVNEAFVKQKTKGFFSLFCLAISQNQYLQVPLILVDHITVDKNY